MFGFDILLNDHEAALIGNGSINVVREEFMQSRKYYNAAYSIGPLWLIGMCINVLRFMLKSERF